MAKLHVFTPRIHKTTDELELWEDQLDAIHEEYEQCESNGITTGQLDLAHASNLLQRKIRRGRGELQYQNELAHVNLGIRFVVLNREEQVIGYHGSLRAAHQVGPCKLFYTIHLESKTGVRECIMRCADRAEGGYKFKQPDWVFTSKRFWDKYNIMVHEHV